MRILFAVFIFIFALSSLSYGEKIELFSGKTYEGMIVEKDDKSLTINTSVGVPITIYLDEVKSIDGIDVVPAQEQKTKIGDSLSLSGDAKSTASATEEVEGYFQKAIQDAQNNMPEEAIKEFKKVVSADFSKLPPKYYTETYSEAYFQMAILKLKLSKELWQESIEDLKTALRINSQHKRASYWLSYIFIENGEVAQAFQYYEKAKTLGFEGESGMGDFVGETLKKFPRRDLSLNYKSAFDSNENVVAHFQGISLADDGLIQDTIGPVEKIRRAGIVHRDNMFTNVKIELVRFKEEMTVVIEKWTIPEDSGESVYWVRYDFTPPEGFPMKIAIQVSEKEIF